MEHFFNHEKHMITEELIEIFSYNETEKSTFQNEKRFEMIRYDQPQFCCFAHERLEIKNELIEFYKGSDKEKTKIILEIIGYKHPRITLRIMDWFVKKYCKKYRLPFKKPRLSDTRFCVYNNSETDTFYFNKVRTSIGQLNYFRWVLKNNIIDYIEENYEMIMEKYKNQHLFDKEVVEPMSESMPVMK